jgi:hypothetical protein
MATFQLPKLNINNLTDINYLNSSIANDIETVIKNIPTKKSSELDGFTADFY